MDAKEALKELVLKRETLAHFDGLAMGEKLGESGIFLRAAKRRFQNIPEHLAAQVHDASPEQLDVWLDRLYEAPDVESVFNGSGNGDASG